jgi:hypothetical protein
LIRTCHVHSARKQARRRASAEWPAGASDKRGSGPPFSAGCCLAWPSERWARSWLTAPSWRSHCHLSLPSRSVPNAQCQMLNAQCPMPSVQCPMPNAQCPMPNAHQYYHRQACSSCCRAAPSRGRWRSSRAVGRAVCCCSASQPWWARLGCSASCSSATGRTDSVAAPRCRCT